MPAPSPQHLLHAAGLWPGVPFPEHEGFMIYDAKGLAKQLLNEEITVGQAECEARLLYQSKAAQLRKQGIWGE